LPSYAASSITPGLTELCSGRRVRHHLEFTKAQGHSAGRAPTADNLLAFYLPDKGEWNAAVGRMKKAGYEPVSSFNPYWDQHGLTFEDPDGYRVVLAHEAWEP